MTVSDFLGQKKWQISVDSILDLKKYYMSMYRYYCMLLYDSNYISDPTRYNESEIRRNLAELKIRGCTSKAGGLKISVKQIEYCLCINHDVSQQKFLNLLHKVLMYREYSMSLDRFYETYGVGNVCLRFKLNRGFVTSLSNVDFNKAIARLLVENLDRKEGTLSAVRCYSMAGYIREKLFEELDIPNLEHQIDDRLSIEDENNLINLIFGYVPPSDLNGENVHKIYEWYSEYSGRSISLVEELVYKNYYEFIDKLNELIEEISSKGEQVILIQGLNVYSRCKRRTQNYPVGYFTVVGDYDNEDLYEDLGINGYTGEGYSEEYLKSEGYGYVGLPIKVNLEDKEVYLYDVEQTSVKFDTYFKSEDLDYTFEEGDLIESPETPEDAIHNSHLGVLGRINLVKE